MQAPRRAPACVRGDTIDVMSRRCFTVSSTVPTSRTDETPDLDDLDHDIIALLSEDASRTYVALAQRLGVTDVTVRNRMRKLVDAEVMRIVAIVDPWRVGRRVQVISGIVTEPHAAHGVANALAQLDEVSYVGYTTGEADLVIVASLRSDEDLFYLLTERIAGIPGIRSIRTSNVLRTIKNTFGYYRPVEVKRRTVS